MSFRDRLAGFAPDERARVPLQWLSQTVAMAAVSIIGWYEVAPMLDVRVLSLIEVVQTIYTTVIPAIHSGTGVSSTFPMGELMLGLSIWMLPVVTVLFGVATVGSALWHVVGRWLWSSPPTEMKVEL